MSRYIKLSDDVWGSLSSGNGYKYSKLHLPHVPISMVSYHIIIHFFFKLVLWYKKIINSISFSLPKCVMDQRKFHFSLRIVQMFLDMVICLVSLFYFLNNPAKDMFLISAPDTIGEESKRVHIKML